MTRTELLKTKKTILFNTEMVKAILGGAKTQTRRVIKNLPEGAHEYMGFDVEEKKHEFMCGIISNGCALDWSECIKSPYNPGDILYVRETWQEVFETEYDHDVEGYCVNIRTLIPNFDNIPKMCMGLSTNDSCALMKPRNKYIVYKASDIKYADLENTLIWHPSIHMPKAAARIFLRVTNVRVERLQDITDDDAMREGVSGLYLPSQRHERSKNNWVRGFCTECIHFNTITKTYAKTCIYYDENESNTHFPSGGCSSYFKLKPDDTPDSAILKFKWLWSDVGVVPGCGYNPWVWVYEFERVIPEGES